jgi:hypothetical protein
VALNENRYLFPGESINRGVQRGFIGSHVDIGGSYATRREMLRGLSSGDWIQATEMRAAANLAFDKAGVLQHLDVL